MPAPMTAILVRCLNIGIISYRHETYQGQNRVEYDRDTDMNYAHSTLTLLLLSACGRGTPCEESTDCGSTEVCGKRLARMHSTVYDVVIIRSEVPN